MISENTRKICGSANTNMQNGLTEQEALLFSQDEQPGNPAYSMHNNKQEE